MGGLGHRVPQALRILGLALGTALVLGCDLRMVFGRKAEDVAEVRPATRLAVPESRVVSVDVPLLRESSLAVLGLQLATALDLGPLGEAVETADIGAGQPGFLLLADGTPLAPVYFPPDQVDSGAVSVDLESIALGLARLLPFAMAIDTASEAGFLEACAQHPEFPALLQDIAGALDSVPASFLDIEVFPHIYMRVARIAAQTFYGRDDAPASVYARAVVGNSTDLHIQDAGASRTGLRVVNPKTTYYGMQVVGGEDYLIRAKEGIIRASLWPPDLGLAQPAETEVPLDDGRYTLVLYKGFNSDEGVGDWLNPFSAAGKATYANSLLVVRLALKTAGLIATATGAGASVGIPLSMAGTSLSQERIEFLLTLDEAMREQDWVHLLADALDAEAATALDVLGAVFRIIADPRNWQQLRSWIWESAEWGSTQAGTRVDNALRSMAAHGDAIHAVLQGLNYFQLANEALPFIWDLATAAWRMEFTVATRGGVVTASRSLQPPSGRIGASNLRPAVGEWVTFQPISLSDDTDQAVDLDVRWDFDGNGVWDLEWGAPSEVSFAYSSRDTYTVLLQIRDSDELVASVYETITVGSAESLKIVLTWGENPRDLDSHLFTPAIDGADYHVYYANRCRLDAAPYAWLDIDDVTSYGPETVWIEALYPGTYTYSVHLYAGTGTLPASGAHVQVIGTDGLLREYDVPAYGSGRWWNVFQLDGTTGQIASVQTITDSAAGGAMARFARPALTLPRKEP